MTENTLRVLIIDDEPAIRKLLKISMQAYGYELGEAATGQDGLLMAASFRPDIILVDLGLPDMDGKAVVKALREWSETPIIVLTAREQVSIGSPSLLPARRRQTLILAISSIFWSTG